MQKTPEKETTSELIERSGDAWALVETRRRVWVMGDPAGEPVELIPATYSPFDVVEKALGYRIARELKEKRSRSALRIAAQQRSERLGTAEHDPADPDAMDAIGEAERRLIADIEDRD